MLEQNENEIRYFGSWTKTRLMLRPSEPITPEEAEKRTSYYIAHYNKSKQLARFEKYLSGSRDWMEEYEYWENGKLKAKRRRLSDRTMMSWQWDSRGRLGKRE